MINNNLCPDCGGRLVVEYIGNYGDVHLLKKDGTPLKRRFKRCIYEHSGFHMIYCKDCGKGIENCE